MALRPPAPSSARVTPEGRPVVGPGEPPSFASPPACAHARQLLSARRDEELTPLERADLDAHLAGCERCRRAERDLDTALGALAALSARDLAELDRPPARRPLLVLTALAAGLALAVGFAAWTGRAPAPSAPPPLAAKRRAPPLPSVGVELAIEVEPLAPAPPPERPAAPEPEPVELALHLPELPQPPAAHAPEPAEPAEPAAPAPAALAAAEPAPPPEPAPTPRLEPPPPPEPVRELLGRLQLSDGLAYRDLTLFFVRDPEGRDRLGTRRAPTPPTVRETAPSGPERCELRPARSDELLLHGELLDAPLGLRIAISTAALKSRMQLVNVLAVAWDGLGDPRRHAPVLPASVLLPSAARAALAKGAQPGPVALLLEALADPRQSETRRLAAVLDQIEPEARELERRLHAIARGTRGLRGLAVSINHRPRSLDVLGGASELTRALPRLLRTALLEAALEREADAATEALGADGDRAITPGETRTRDDHRALLALFADARRLQEAPRANGVSAVYRASGPRGVTLVFVDEDGRLVHAAALR